MRAVVSRVAELATVRDPRTPRDVGLQWARLNSLYDETLRALFRHLRAFLPAEFHLTQWDHKLPRGIVVIKDGWHVVKVYVDGTVKAYTNVEVVGRIEQFISTLSRMPLAEFLAEAVKKKSLEGKTLPEMQ